MNLRKICGSLSLEFHKIVLGVKEAIQIVMNLLTMEYMVKMMTMMIMMMVIKAQTIIVK